MIASIMPIVLWAECCVMSRMSRAEIFDPNEVVVAHVYSRVVRKCFLFGDDPVSGKNFDHRKVWIENYLQQFAAEFGIDLLGFAILSNHFHLILRSRPDVVATWDDEEVARRWMMLCPNRRSADGAAMTPTQPEINSIAGCPIKRAEIRKRLSSISWWMRLLCQRVAQRANHEDEETGRFFQDRFKATRLTDEASLLACAAYVDLNPIRAAICETLEESDHTSVQRRIEALGEEQENVGNGLQQDRLKIVDRQFCGQAFTKYSRPDFAEQAAPECDRVLNSFMLSGHP